MSLYALKPVVSLPELLSLPKIMYEMPNILNQEKLNENFTDNYSRQKDIREYHFLEARQMRILKKVKEMKQHIEFLRVAIRLSNIVKIPYIDLPFINRKIQPNRTSINAEVIIYVNPKSLPYAILALQNIWEDTKFNLNIYRHSSIVIDPIMNKFEDMLATKIKNKTIHNININFIWKDVSNFQFITEVNSYSINGEVNFLRYLFRTMRNYDYENYKSPKNIVSIDNILDLCIELSYEKSKNINDIAKFGNYLSKNSWFLNYSNASIGDIAAWSIIKQKAHNKIPCKLKKWYDLCEKTFIPF